MKTFHYGISVILISILLNGCGVTLQEVVRSGDLALVKEKVDGGADINDKGNGYFTSTPLIDASHLAKLEIVKYLVEKGANINAKGIYGQTALHLAVSSGEIEKVKYLIEKGANINAKDKYGQNVLHSTSTHSEVNIIKYLLAKGMDVDAKDSSGQTTLHKAALHGNINVIQFFIDNGADINTRSQSGDTILFNPVIIGNLEVVKYLVDKGVDINAKGVFGTVLSRAVSSGKFDIVKYLIEKGADVNTKDVLGRTNLDIAIASKKHNIVAYLKELPNLTAKKKEQEKKHERTIQKQNEQREVETFISKNDLQGLKSYTDQNPNAVYYIKDESFRLLLTGPKGLKVGDIKKHIKKGRSEKILIAMIQRVKTPYKEFTFYEVDILIKMELSDDIIAAMINTTTKLLENEEKRKEQEFFLKEQDRIQKQEIKETIVYKDNANQKVDAQGNPIMDKVQSEVIKQGVGVLFDKLF